MSITIELSPETLARLQTKAAERLSVGEYIAELAIHNAEDTNNTETELEKSMERLLTCTPAEKATQRRAILAASRNSSRVAQF
jgi:hypothetical protein